MNGFKYAWFPAILLMASIAFGQINETEHHPFKDLIFPQVAAGGEYQTWVTVTNRGPESYDGTLVFRKGQGQAWNTYVNGAQISGGILIISIPPKATRTYKVTLPGSTEVGYLLIRAEDVEHLNNFIQGNVAYYVGTGGQINDSVGVMPSNPFFAATLPFEDFDALCFALANTDVYLRDTNVKFDLYSEENELLGTYTLPLLHNEHTARYLWQMFESVTIDRGRVEIESDVPVSGMALIQSAGGQYSSLPLEATARTYSITSTGAEIHFPDLTLWMEGVFVKGYLTLEREGAFELFAVTGSFRGQKMYLHFDGNSQATSDSEIFGYIVPNVEWVPSLTEFTGVYCVEAPEWDYLEIGSFAATLVP